MMPITTSSSTSVNAWRRRGMIRTLSRQLARSASSEMNGKHANPNGKRRTHWPDGRRVIGSPTLAYVLRRFNPCTRWGAKQNDPRRGGLLLKVRGYESLLRSGLVLAAGVADRHPCVHDRHRLDVAVAEQHVHAIFAERVLTGGRDSGRVAGFDVAE